MNKRHKILVVDDNPSELLLMEALLKPYNYDVVTLADNKRTLKTVREEKPDIILMDILMPFDDGYTLLNKIKRDKTMNNIPILMVSALDYDGNKLFASICGASAYITKPIDKGILLETIASFLHDSMPLIDLARFSRI